MTASTGQIVIGRITVPGIYAIVGHRTTNDAVNDIACFIHVYPTGATTFAIGTFARRASYDYTSMSSSNYTGYSDLIVNNSGGAASFVLTVTCIGGLNLLA